MMWVCKIPQKYGYGRASNDLNTSVYISIGTAATHRATDADDFPSMSRGNAHAGGV